MDAQESEDGAKLVGCDMAKAGSERMFMCCWKKRGSPPKTELMGIWDATWSWVPSGCLYVREDGSA